MEYNPLQVRKQGQVLFYVEYNWKNGTYMKAQVFMKTRAGAIAKTFPLAIACGFGNEPEEPKVVITSFTDDILTGHTVETNAFQKLKNSRSMSANEKRECMAKISEELTEGLYLNPDAVKKLGRIIR